MRDYSCEKIRKYEPWRIIHCYLINAVFPSCFKQAAVPPLLKKPSTHPEDSLSCYLGYSLQHPSKLKSCLDQNAEDKTFFFCQFQAKADLQVMVVLQCQMGHLTLLNVLSPRGLCWGHFYIFHFPPLCIHL